MDLCPIPRPGPCPFKIFFDLALAFLIYAVGGLDSPSSTQFHGSVTLLDGFGALSFGEWAWSGSLACTSHCGSARLMCEHRHLTVQKL
ncbi:hypothetical protein DVH24_032701 [Malus domestica]|uniref:Leucine-rich repeat-containing N-terminal plant-type domain-containing protein n=1 Tax=Malus domestica TaxID=3750 RepID=A0A498J849_MALDO|nr:hypothetical protein DVH24_032701 [Malus domestica]